MPRCSVVIPAHNAALVLPAALDALFVQTVPSGWTIEVVISDDGSTDATRTVAQQAVLPRGWIRQIISEAKAGPGEARNRGVRAATGDIILFLQADILLRLDALQAHLQFHETNPSIRAAALGYVMWDPTIIPSRLMIWMMHGGHHNNYDALLGQRQIDPTHFLYGSCTSLKRQLLIDEPFNPLFLGYGWEDLELGRRLTQRGVSLHLLAAQALHRHYYRVADICARQYAAGQNLHIYHQLHPNSGIAPRMSRWQVFKHRLAALVGFPMLLQWSVTYINRYITIPDLFELLTAVYFWQGWLAGPPTRSKKA